MSKRVAFSFDDAPRHAGPLLPLARRASMLVDGLRTAGIEQAAFFVVSGNIARHPGSAGPSWIGAYTGAGHVLGNHSDTHRALSHVDPDTFVADLDRARERLAHLHGYRPWFRYPYLDEGDDAPEARRRVRAALQERGLSNGYITIRCGDHVLDDLASRAYASGRVLDMTALLTLYVESVLGAAEFYEAVARRALGYSPVHMLLLHETDLNALFVPDLARGLRDAGWQIVTADEAYRDPLVDPGPAYRAGSGRVAAWGLRAGMRPADLVCPPVEPATLARRFADRVVLREPSPAETGDF